MHQNVNYHLAQVIETSPDLQLEQDKRGSEMRYKITNNPSTFERGNLGTSFVSIVTKEEARGSHGCSSENVEEADRSIIRDVWKQCDQENFNKLVHSENTVVMEIEDDLAHTESILQETKPQFKSDCLNYYWDVSPQNRQLASVGSNQTGSQIERFTIDAKENKQPHGISNSFDNFKLPSTAIERASVLEQLCKTVSSDTPLSQFLTTTLEQNGTPGLYQYVLNGQKYSPQGVSYPCYDWSSAKPYTSPVGMVYRNSKSSSLEKQRSLNSELTCYPIEEDHSVGGENENIDEAADIFEEDLSSTLVTFGTKREPLAEIAEAHVDCPTSVSAVENSPDRTSLASVNTEVSITETHSRVEQKHGNRYSNKRGPRRCKNEAVENHTSSIRTNCVNEATNKSVKNRSNGPNFSGKTKLRNRGQSISEKESKRSKVVSNITSFVPLIQQKQASAIGTGKRQIKVKALQAAKCLEEKRHIEGKMKKEALKLERARVEQVCFRQMELKKKKKEEEQKRKDADTVARKRLREEEEKKEKERKRKRTEEARQRRDGKLRVGKVEKEDAKVTNKKETKCDFRKHQKLEKEGDNNTRRQQQTEPRAADSSTSNVIQAVNNCEAASVGDDSGEPTSILTTTTEKHNWMAKTIREKSYEISPYLCSDGEEDDENEIPTKKFIPSWASKSSVARVLLSQTGVDPDIIFPHESFCNIDEVVRPRELQLK